MATNRVHVGPWGGKGGVNPWTFIPEGRICQIRISTGGCVDSIRFTYIDRDNVKKPSKTYGGDGGSPQTIKFADDEDLIEISGTMGEFHSFTVITSLSFQTNKKNHGPYGTTQGTSFSLPVAKGSFGGFSGTNGGYLHSFGVILHPSPFEDTIRSNMVPNGIHVGPWGGKGGNNPWKFMASGRPFQIHINTGLCVDSIMFTYIDQDHVKHQSQKYGGDGGSPQKITFADGENLIGISGTVGVFNNFSVITSLSFQTNKKNHGPYGTNNGTSFSLPVAEGRFGGFHGKNGDYLDSLGVILQPPSFDNTLESNTACIQLGLWGSSGGGNPWTFSIPANGRISQICICAASCVDSIQFTCIDKEKHYSKKFGGDGGSPHTITFADDEYLIEISGTVGVFNCVTWIASLSFKTNKNNHGPYGTTNGTSFSLPVPNGRFVGFFGNFREEYLDSFGFILHDYE